MVNVAIGADTVYLAGNSEHISLLGGPSAHIYDQGSNMSVDVFGSAGTDVISGFANDPTGVIDLLSGSGGFSSVGQVLKALHSDGNGGTLLSLGHSGSIDFLGVAPAQLHASNFRIG
jgi:hypothetical protein